VLDPLVGVEAHHIGFLKRIVGQGDDGLGGKAGGNRFCGDLH
jgi:hypothetical protein